MKKIVVVVFCIVLIISTAFAMVACDNTPQLQIKSYMTAQYATYELASFRFITTVTGYNTTFRSYSGKATAQLGHELSEVQIKFNSYIDLMGESLAFYEYYLKFSGTLQDELQWDGDIKNYWVINNSDDQICMFENNQYDDDFVFEKEFKLYRNFNGRIILGYSIYIKTKEFSDENDNKFAIEFMFNYDKNVEIN